MNLINFINEPVTCQATKYKKQKKNLFGGGGGELAIWFKQNIVIWNIRTYFKLAAIEEFSGHVFSDPKLRM